MSSPRLSSWAALCWLLLGILALAWTAVVPASLRLVYNASDSAPRGFYMVRPAVDLRVGDYVVARLPEAAARFAAARGYLPRSVPVLKQIAAIEGHVACVRDGAVALDEADDEEDDRPEDVKDRNELPPPRGLNEWVVL